MTTLRRMMHIGDPAKQAKVKQVIHGIRIGCWALLVGLILWALSGCAHSGTPAQQEAARVRRGKNLAKLEGFAWNLVTDFAVNTLSNLAREAAGSRGGFAK
jgi:hypothetical protein